MPGRVPSSDGPWPGTGTDSHYVPLGQTACFLLSLFKGGVACCLPTCAHGSSVPVMENAVVGVFCAFWFLLGVLCIWGVLVLLVSLLCTRVGLLRCASCWTRPLGGGRWGHYLRDLWGEHLKIHKVASMKRVSVLRFFIWEPYMLASVGQPSLHGNCACMVYWTKGALRRNCRHKQCKTSFSPFWVFLFSQNSLKRYRSSILWHLWIWRAKHLGPPSLSRHAGIVGSLMVTFLWRLGLIFLLLLGIG